MSVVGVSPGSPEAANPRAVQPVALYDPATGAVLPMGTGTSSQSVQGAGADGAAPVGNGVTARGLYETATTIALKTAGTVNPVQSDAYGQLRVVCTGRSVSSVDTASTTIQFFNQTTNASSGAAPLGVGGYIWNKGTSAWNLTTKPVAVARIVSAAASTNATVVKASPGDLFKVTLYNANAAARYLKLYNKATAPTVGTDVPILTEYLPAQSKTTITFESPLNFAAGISLALTTGSADSDTGALTAADVLALNVAYA